MPPQHFARVSSVIPLFLCSADVTRVPGPSGWADEGERRGGAPVPGPARESGAPQRGRGRSAEPLR